MDVIDLRKIRFAFGLSQKEMADLLQCTQGMVSKLETGQRELTIDQRVKLRSLTGGKKVVLRKKV